MYKMRVITLIYSLKVCEKNNFYIAQVIYKL